MRNGWNEPAVARAMNSTSNRGDPPRTTKRAPEKSGYPRAELGPKQDARAKAEHDYRKYPLREP